MAVDAAQHFYGNSTHHSPSMRTTLSRLSPGTDLHDALERILRGRTGALIVLGFDETVEQLCDGGLELDVPFAATRLRELCKMDGAVVLSTDGTRIKRANVQLIPDPSYPTSESGTRHRTAERTALHTGYPVISVSQSMNMITLYADAHKHILQDSSVLISRANQTLATMERYRLRLNEEEQYLFRSELHGYTTVSDVIAVIQRMEMLRRAAETVDHAVIELGTDGTQVALQLAELLGDNERGLGLIVRDYLAHDPIAHTPPIGNIGTTHTETMSPAMGTPDSETAVATALKKLCAISDQDILKTTSIMRVLGYPVLEDTLAHSVAPRGYRILGRVPRVQIFHMDRLVEHFATLSALLAATPEDLAETEGIGDIWARHIYDGLQRAKTY